MKVDVGEDFIFIFNQFQNRIDRWIETLIRADELPIQIPPRQSRPVIPNDNPIWVQHRHNLEDDPLPDGNCLAIATEQEPQEPLHHSGAIALTRMNPGGQDNNTAG